MSGGWPSSTTTCPPGCGLCCEEIALSDGAVERIFGPTYDERATKPDTWAAPESSSDKVPNPRHLSWLHDAEFIREHFHFLRREVVGTLSPQFGNDQSPTTIFRCDAFDPEARACTRYDERPLMCENYPWYGRNPATREPTDHPVNDLTCVFQGDVPGRRVLPIIEVR